MWNNSLRWVVRAVLVAGISGLWSVGGGCESGVTDFSGFGPSGVTDAQIIGLQGDLQTSCGGFGCNFDFSSDF